MKNGTKLILSVFITALGVWLLLPEIPFIKPATVFGFNIVLWANLISVLKGVIPVGIFLFGALLLWIEYDEFKTQRSIEGDKEEEEEMPAFEDVEYKDLECPECGEDFKTDIGLKVHRKVNHPDSYEGD